MQLSVSEEKNHNILCNLHNLHVNEFPHIAYNVNKKKRHFLQYYNNNIIKVTD